MSTIVSTFLCESVGIIGSMTFKLVLLIIFKRTLNLRSKSHRVLVSTFLCESMRIIGSMKFKLVLNIIFKCTLNFRSKSHRAIVSFFKVRFNVYSGLRGNHFVRSWQC